MEFTLLAAAALAVIALSLTLRMAPAQGVTAAFSRRLTDPAYTAIGFGILVGRLASMIGNGTNPLSHVGDILIIRGGVSTGFASMAAIGAWLYSTRRDLRVASDAVGVGALMGLAGWHGGCLLRDACAGASTQLPWAISLPGSTVGRHPVELYAAALCIMAALLLRRLPAGSGSAAGWALAAAAAARLVTEPLRLSLGSGPLVWYGAGLVLGLTIAAVAPRYSHRSLEAS